MTKIERKQNSVIFIRSTKTSKKYKLSAKNKTKTNQTNFFKNQKKPHKKPNRQTKILKATLNPVSIKYLTDGQTFTYSVKETGKTTTKSRVLFQTVQIFQSKSLPDWFHPLKVKNFQECSALKKSNFFSLHEQTAYPLRTHSKRSRDECKWFTLNLKLCQELIHKRRAGTFSPRPSTEYKYFLERWDTLVYESSFEDRDLLKYNTDVHICFIVLYIVFLVSLFTETS